MWKSNFGVERRFIGNKPIYGGKALENLVSLLFKAHLELTDPF